MNQKETKHIFIDEQKPNIPKSKITIKLIGDANELTEIVSDINQQYRINKKCNDQESLQANSKLDSEPSKKKLKIKEEFLPQRVVLVVPKNSTTHYQSSSNNKNDSTCNKNQSKNGVSNFQHENLKVKNEQLNDKSLIQIAVDDKNENTNSEYAKLSDSNETCQKDMEYYNGEHKILRHNHEAKSTQLKQMTNPENSSKQLNETKSSNIRPVVGVSKFQIIKKAFKFKDTFISPIEKKLTAAENMSRSYTLPKNGKNGMQSISGNNPVKKKFLLNNSIPIKMLHLPIILKKNKQMNHLKLLKKKQKVLSNTVSMNDAAAENKTSPSRSSSNLTEIMNILTDSKLVNSVIMNQSFENKSTINSPVCPKDCDVSLTSLERNETYPQSSSQQNTRITIKDQEHSPKNTEIDVRSHNHLNSNTSGSITESNSQNQQNTIPLGSTSDQVIQAILNNREKKVFQESNNYTSRNSLEIPEKKKYIISSGTNKKTHHVNNEKQYIKSPQIKINGLTIRAPDPHLLNNLSFQEKIQKFRLSNASCKKTDHHKNSRTLPEVSESLVSTTTVESGQSDKQIRECQCDQLRQEVDEQWKIITRLRSRINLSLKNNSIKCDSLAEEENQLEDESYFSSLLLKELEETNIKISENLRREQIRNKKLKLTLKYRSTRIKQLELKLKTISKFFEETEKSALFLRAILQSTDEATDSVSTQSGIFNQ